MASETYEEKIAKQQEVVKTLAEEYKKTPSEELELKLNRETDLLRQMTNSATGNPKDRSKVASFYGQSVCLVEYLCTLKGPQGFVSYMRDANREGDAAALPRGAGAVGGVHHGDHAHPHHRLVLAAPARARPWSPRACPPPR